MTPHIKNAHYRPYPKTAWENRASPRRAMQLKLHVMSSYLTHPYKQDAKMHMFYAVPYLFQREDKQEFKICAYNIDPSGLPQRYLASSCPPVSKGCGPVFKQTLTGWPGLADYRNSKCKWFKSYTIILIMFRRYIYILINL